MSIRTLRIGLFILGVLIMRPPGVAASDGVHLQDPDGGAVRGLIIGIDRFMSEARALVNVIGNGVATLVISRTEGELDLARVRAVLDGKMEQAELLEASGSSLRGAEERAVEVPIR